MRRKWVLFATVLLTASLVLTACAPEKVVETVVVTEVVQGQEKVIEKVITATPALVEEKPSEPSMPKPGELKVALLMDNVINDGGWNQNVYDGLASIKTEYLADTAYTESVDRASMETVFEDYAARGYQLIFAHGFEFSDAAGVVAERYPNSYFVVTHASSDVLAKNLPNLASLQMNEEQPSYLMGIIAGSLTKTNKCTGVGSYNIPPISIPYEAFLAGAKSVNPDFVMNILYLDTYTDNDKALEAAKAAVAAGADCLFPQVGTVPVHKMAEEKGILSYGYAGDMNSVAPDAVPTSVITDYAVAMVMVTKDYIAGKFKPGEYWLGMKDNTVRLAPFHGFDEKFPQELKDLIEETTQKIKDGEFKVPVDWSM